MSIRNARNTYRDSTFHPRILQDVSDVDTSAVVLGQHSPLPLVFAPTGFTRLMHHEGENGSRPCGRTGRHSPLPLIRWAPPRLRMSPRRRPAADTGSSSTRGRTALPARTW
ncbi:alpha-hydroxy-acid oxidizing protein [Rhodococcus qingshengii]|uniref:alpha-hydroxy-acid oxidizing protein n=1 Tax=Rhodococcus TaxID=1827 RepID=UPI0033957016